MMKEKVFKDYSLVGRDADLAVEKGLAEADWYTSPVPKAEMRKLIERKNGPAIRDTIIWFALIFGTGYWAYAWWGSVQAIIPFLLYGVLYASTSDSRWHESSHGTAFKSDWMNVVLYEISSFMVMRESTLWRWSHVRHHSDTIIVGRDPEIVYPRPPDIKKLILSFFGVGSYTTYFKQIIKHSLGELTEEEKSYIPEEEQPYLIFKARIYVLIYLAVIATAIYYQTILPLLFIGLTNLYGSWLMVIYGTTQHAGLAENVLDHRLNSRTVYMNFIHRYLYWNMNYHLEHHMFPLVPYHALPKLHKIIKSDSPKPYNGLIETYKEIIPALRRQVKDPTYFVERILPKPKTVVKEGAFSFDKEASSEGWVPVCGFDEIQKEDVVRFNHGNKTYAVYKTASEELYASDGICTHGNTHLSEGLVKGDVIECPKHNGRFNMKDGSPARNPVCIALKTYPIRLEDGMIHMNVNPLSFGDRLNNQEKQHSFKVVSNENVSTFIKELVLEPVSGKMDYQPGDYFQIDIPVYEKIQLSDLKIGEEYQDTWQAVGINGTHAKNDADTRRNYSVASNPALDKEIRFNVRLAMPPKGTHHMAGIGSSYVHNLSPGDVITGIGPYGDFRIKETEKEMVYLGGGAGMAPLRSHISYLLETLKTNRKISFWYGARSKKEVFYQSYFEELAKKHENFSFHLALSEPLDCDQWEGPTGFIHNVLKSDLLNDHGNISGTEFYLCGPPAMISSATDMLKKEFSVSEDQIAFDEF